MSRESRRPDQSTIESASLEDILYDPAPVVVAHYLAFLNRPDCPNRQVVLDIGTLERELTLLGEALMELINEWYVSSNRLEDQIYYAGLQKNVRCFLTRAHTVSYQTSLLKELSLLYERHE
jgi:hypothetical protein